MKNNTPPHEIYTALMIIKMVCEENNECCTCPLRSPKPNYACGLNDIPRTWKIRDHNEYNAFKR